MQFGEDWPGLFLRGDNCREYWTLLESVLAAMESGRVPTMYEASHLRTLVGVLKATDQSQLDAGQSHVQQLRDYADCQPDGGE